MRVVMSFGDQVMSRFGAQLQALGDGRMKQALGRALRHTGAKTRTQVVRALTAQTGLKMKTIRKAVRVESDGSSMEYILVVRGGNVRLKYFGARETAKGVSAAPWNSRRVYGSTFMKAGWWPKRVTKPGWNGQVFRRLGGKTKAGKDKFEAVRSGLFIPDELITGRTRAAWEKSVQTDLLPRVEHEIRRLMP